MTQCEYVSFPGKDITLCPQCIKYMRDCINNVSDRAIACRYSDYPPFVVILTIPYTVISFTEICAIRWCELACQADDDPVRAYYKALLLCTWLYVQLMPTLVDNVRRIIINLTLHDNDLGINYA